MVIVRSPRIQAYLEMETPTMVLAIFRIALVGASFLGILRTGWALSPVPATSPPGFLFPIGGGAGTGNNETLKPAQVEIHKAAVHQLSLQRKQGAPIGPNVCIVEYHEDDAETQEVLKTAVKLFRVAGMPSEQLESHIVATRAQATDREFAKALERRCGLFYIPGGDQTQMLSLWKDSDFHDALRSVLKRGGGLMGKSAGAAIQGTLIFLPQAQSETDSGSFLKGRRVEREEFETEFLGDALGPLPRLYIETHAGDRERSARALALLAFWEHSFARREPMATALAIDSDTGVLLLPNAKRNAWSAQVFGGRAAEILRPTRESVISLTSAFQPIYTHAESTLLLSGGRFEISALPGYGGNQDEHATPELFYQATSSSCVRRLPETIDGSEDRDAEAGSQISFDALDRASGRRMSMGEVEYAYLTGDLLPRKGSGCGYWLSNSFDVEHGKPENRLNAMRFVLASNLAEFAVALPPGMRAHTHHKNRDTDDVAISFSPRASDQGEGSSLLLIHALSAREKKTGSYIYREFGATQPVQTGTWLDARAHLIPPHARFYPERGTVTLEF